MEPRTTAHAAAGPTLPADGTPRPSDPTELPSGDDEAAPELPRGASLDRYVVLERLGAGGMGVVYTAYDPQLDRRVAIKLLRGDRGGHASAARLLREAKAIARVTHPNVVAVHDVGVTGDRVYVAIEFVDGQTLRAWQKGRPWREVVDMYLQAGRGLAAAHRAGLVHRDFKPDNVLVDADGRARVLDFGLARAVAGETLIPGQPIAPPPSEPDDLHSDLTQEGSIVGTPAYMAPEQRLAVPVDARCDQFSFCVALWEGLTGQLPFAGESTLALLAAIREQRTRPVPRDRDVPAWALRAVLRGLKVRPEDRFPDIDALLAELAHDPAQTRRRRLGTAAAALAVAGVAVLAGMSLGTDANAPCGGAAQRVAGVWDAQQRDAVRAAFRATGQPYAEEAAVRVARRLDAYLHAWQVAYGDACAATQLRGEQSPDLMDRRMACLQERLAEAQALVRTFTAADAAVVQRAPQAVAELRPLTTCADLRALGEAGSEPVDPAQRSELAALRTRLAEAWAADAAGRHKVAAELAAPIAGAAASAGACGLAADARRLDGYATCRSGQLERGAAELAEAVWSATACRRDEVAADAALALVYCVGVRQARLDEVEVWSRHAEAAIARLGGEQDVRRASLLGYRGLIAFDRGDYDEARALQQQALALAERALPPDSPRLGVYAGYLGVTLGQLGELDAALQLHRRALALTEQAVGRVHPLTAVHLNNVALVLAQLGQSDEALAYHERDLEVSLRTLGPNNPDTVLSYLNHSALLGELGRAREALGELLRAREVLVAAGRLEHPDHVLLLVNLGSAWSNLGHDDEARAVSEDAFALSRRLHGDYHLEATFADLTLARADLRAGRADEALARVERVRAFHARSVGESHEDTAEADAEVGRILAGLGRCDDARPRFAAARAVMQTRLAPTHPHLRMLEWYEAACADPAARVAAGASALKTPGPPDLRAEVLLRAAESAWSQGQTDMAKQTGDEATRILENTGPALAPLRAQAAALRRRR